MYPHLLLPFPHRLLCSLHFLLFEQPFCFAKLTSLYMKTSEINYRLFASYSGSAIDQPRFRPSDSVLSKLSGSDSMEEE